VFGKNRAEIKDEVRFLSACREKTGSLLRGILLKRGEEWLLIKTGSAEPYGAISSVLGEGFAGDAEGGKISTRKLGMGVYKDATRRTAIINVPGKNTTGSGKP